MRSKPMAVFPLVALGACGFADDVDPPEQHAFEGSFNPLADRFAALGGSVAALSAGAGTTISFSIHGLDPEMEVSWKLSEGVCESPQDAVVDPAAFQPLEADDTGQIRTGDDRQPPGGDTTSTPNPTFGGQLNPELRYAVELFEGDSASGDPIACADLENVEDPGSSSGGA